MKSAPHEDKSENSSFKAKFNVSVLNTRHFKDSASNVIEKTGVIIKDQEDILQVSAPCLELKQA